LAQALGGLAAARKQQADAERAREAARLAAIAQQQRDDCAFAQTFNSLVAYSNLPAGGLSTITFPREQTFELRNRMWGFGDALLRGPGGHPWFQMVRTNPSLFGELFRNCHFCISTMAGEPLLVLQERFSWMNYQYDLFRIDPRTQQHVPVCRIVREWTLFAATDVYTVSLFGPTAHGGSGVRCHGRWPNQFTLSVDGLAMPAASVNKQFLSLTDTYHVRIAPRMDVLLFLGIACAIDRIHHEVEDERRRRER